MAQWLQNVLFGLVMVVVGIGALWAMSCISPGFCAFRLILGIGAIVLGLSSVVLGIYQRLRG